MEDAEYSGCVKIGTSMTTLIVSCHFRNAFLYSLLLNCSRTGSDCWETRFGQEIYKLIIIHFFFSSLLRVFTYTSVDAAIAAIFHLCIRIFFFCAYRFTLYLKRAERANVCALLIIMMAVDMRCAGGVGTGKICAALHSPKGSRASL